MENQDKYDKVLMATAMMWSKESYCTRRKVGAVLSIDGRPLMTGYNGTISGMDNCCEDVSYKCVHCGNESKTVDAYTMYSHYSAQHMGLEFSVICNKCRKTVWDGTVPLFKSTPSYVHPQPQNNLNIDPDIMALTECVVLKTNEFTLHAEQNVITYCARKGISTEGATLHVTTSPCKTCSKLIASVGIKRVVYLDEYRDDGGIKYLKEVGVDIQKYKGDVIW